MSFQRRVTLASAAAVAVAVAIASLATYVLVRNDLHRHVNRSLQTLAGAFVQAEARLPGATVASSPPSRRGRQQLDTDTAISLFGSAAPLPRPPR